MLRPTFRVEVICPANATIFWMTTLRYYRNRSKTTSRESNHRLPSTQWLQCNQRPRSVTTAELPNPSVLKGFSKPKTHLTLSRASTHHRDNLTHLSGLKITMARMVGILNWCSTLLGDCWHLVLNTKDLILTIVSTKAQCTLTREFRGMREHLLAAKLWHGEYKTVSTAKSKLRNKPTTHPLPYTPGWVLRKMKSINGVPLL